jgi:hypothetical protein
MVIRSLCLAAFLIAAVSPAPSQSPAGKLTSLQPASQATQSPVPALVPFAGIASDTDGKPLTAEAGIAFQIYRDEQGGEPLWTETQSVQPDATGHYKVQLGAATATGLPLELFANGDARWLEVQIAGQRPQPRIMLISVPYALKAADAATLGGLPASAFALAGAPTAAAKSASVVPDLSSTVTTSSGTAGFLPIFTSPTDIENSPIGQKNYVVINNQFQDAMQVGSPGLPDAFVVNGPLVSAASSTATASAGANSQPQDFTASAFEAGSQAWEQTFAWQAEPAGNNTGNPSATLNLLFGGGRNNQASETGFSWNSDGTVNFSPNQIFTFNQNQTFPITGTGGGTVTTIKTGGGLAGGPITTSGVISIAVGGVLNYMLANDYVNIATGNGLTGGGQNQLGSNGLTLAVDSTKVPLLGAPSNTFTGGIEANELATDTNLLIGADTRIDPIGFSNGNYAGIQTGNIIHGIRFGNGGTGEGIASDRAGTVNVNGIDLFTDFIPRLSITNSGSVGIGATAPTAKLEVNGTTAITGNTTLGGTLTIGGDRPMKHNPRMIFSGFFMGSVSNSSPGGFFTPDQSIVITRIEASIGQVGSGCSKVAQISVADAVSGVPYASADVNNSSSTADSGPLAVFVPAGTGKSIKLVGAPGTVCTNGAVQPGNIFINVQYAMN